MRRHIGRLVTLCALIGLLVPGGISVSYATCPAPGVSAASGARVTCPPAPDPNQAAYAKLRKRLGGDVARALASQEQLSIALLESAASEQNLKTHIASEEAKVAALEAQISQLETADLSTRRARSTWSRRSWQRWLGPSRDSPTHCWSRWPEPATSTTRLSPPPT